MADLLHTLRNPSLQTGVVFGLSTAVSEGLLVVGSPAADRSATNDGSVQVFDADSGVLLRELRNPTPADNDYFGFSVAISGSLVVIGAHNDDAGATDAGAAYVFDANTGNLLRTLSNPTPAASDAFGYSVDISGSTVVVGAFGDDTGAPNAGSVYVFDVTTGELWQTLNKPTPAVGDSFGWSVAISGSMVVAGAINDDTGAPDTGSVYVFDATAGNLLRTLNNPTPATSDQFGNSVAISGNTVAVGASRDDAGALNAGSAYVFDAATGSLLRTLTNPAPAATDEFGSSVAISAGRVAVGAYFDDSGATDAGSAYVFDATTGSLLQTIGNPAPAASDYFGKSVAISESKILVGASGDDVGATNTGSAFLFDAATGNPLHTLIMPMPPTSDDFGRSVALSGNRLVAGATRNDMGATDSGLAFVYDATTGSLLRTLYNPTPATLDNFGYSVAMSGGIVLVGAYQDDTGAQNAGAAYLFDEATGNLLRTLNNPAPDSSDHFGYSVAISGTTVVVGAPYDDTSATNAGSAYLFDAATGNLLRTLNYPVPASSGSFGISVAISGTTVVVGAPSHDAGAPYAGCVYLFDVNTGNLLQTLSKPTPAIYDNFGEAVAISGTTVIVGTRYDNTGAMDAGAVYLFDADTGNLLRTLSNPTPADSDNFGESVAISGATVIVGTPYDDTGAINAGSAYVFDAATGALLATVPNPAPQSGDNFGRSLAAWGDVFAVGAPADDDGAVDTGSAYLFAGATTPVNSPATITGTAAGSLAENAVSNATGGTLTVTDADAGQALFQSPSAASLVGTYGVFTFNPTTGVWDYTLDNGNPATDLLNAGQQVSETLTVVSLDGTARQAIVLTISGADDAPWFTSPATAWLAENTATVLTLSASDHDLPAQTVTFSITGGADGDRFHITGGSQLEFRVPPDFETRGDVGGDVDYEVEVTATDSGNPPGSTSQLLRVRVTPVNDNFPAFTSPDSPRLGENTTAVLTLAASDADLPPQTLTFAITGGVDRDLFQLANGNQLEFRAAPVHDTPLDADRDNVYELEVLADDGNGLTTPQLVRVTILARPRANPGGPYETSEGTPVLLDASASTDPDSAAALLAYDWDLDYDGVTFQVDASGGAPSVLFTDDSLARTIAVRVTDPDGLADIVTATVTVHNVPPTIHGLGGGPVAAGQEVAVFVHATDPADYEDSLLYEFDFDNDGTFETTGSGLGVGRYTFTATGNYTVSVRVSDGDGGVATASTTVDVLTTVSFTAASGTASEGSGMVTIQAELGEAQLTDVLVPLFVSGSAQAMSDFTPAVSAIVIAAGSLTGTVVLQVIDDFRSEDTETVVLTIPTGWTGQTVLRGAVSEFTLSIADNEPAASPPVASAGGPYVVNEAEDIRLDASATTDTGQPTETLAFEWDLDYDQVTFQVDAIGPRPYVRFADNSAERTIAVRVGDSDGLTSLAMTTVRVDNVPPVITNAWSDSPVRTGTPVRISVNASDLAGASDPLLYEFDFDNSGNYETGNYDGIATHTYTSSGYYHVPIRVSDGDGGSATSSITVHVRTTVSFSVSSSTLAEEAAGPLLIWAELGEIQTHEIDEWLQFGGSASNSSDYTIHDIFLTIPAGSLMGSFPIVSVDDWRSDPGETIELRLLGSSNFVPGVTPVHTVTIIDNEPPASPPEAHAGGPYTIGENLELRLDASATTDSGQPTPTLSFEWDLDYDGTTFQADTHGMQPFSRFGEDFPARMIGVRVIDADGLSDIATTTLTVTNRPPIITYLSNSTLPGLVGPAGRGDAFYVTVRAADGPSDPVSIAFDFDNDGTMDEVHDPGSTNPTVVTSHSFSHTGSHIVTVRATDDEGDSVDGTTTVRVLPRISFTSSGQTVDEHPGGDVLITAELDEAFSEDIVVPLKTSGSADSFYDYRYVSPQISIPAGETRGTATVRIHDDPFLDPDEELVLTLQLPTNVLPGTFTTHTIRIIDDDRPPVAHAGGPYMAEEAALFTLDGSGSSDPNQSTNTLHYAWDLDYDGLTFDSDVIGIRPNARLSDSFSPRTIAVRVEDYGDAFDIATTTLEVVNLPPRILSITDDGPAAPGSELTVSVLASDPAGPNDPLTYEFDFDNDGVYEISNDTGAAGHAFPVNGNRVVGIRISDGDGGHAVSVTTVSVAPRVSFTAASQANVSENVGEVVITAEIEEAQASDVRVPLIRTGTIEPNDFSVPELVLRISAGERVGQITVKVVDDDRDELDDTLTLSMGKPIGASLGAVTTHSVTIVDNDVPPQVWFTRNPFPSPTIDEGATAWVFAKLSQPSDFEVTVPLQVSGPVNASDYAWTSPGGSQITIAPGRSSNDTNPALLRIEDDGDIERLESITLTMSAPTSAGSLVIDTPIPLIVEVYDDGIGNPYAPQIPGFGGGAGGGSGASIPVNPKTEPPAPAPTGGAGNLVIVLDGYISHGITFFDANRNGQYDFLDLNGNGWRDEDEPQDRAYLTAPDGGFFFSIPEVFDRNGDGVIDWTEGQLVSVGGVDTTTQLPSRVTMRAPMGFYVVSPLTTVIADLINEHGFTLDEAVARARAGLALPDSQFARSSFIYEASQGDADAGLLFATSVKLHNTVVQWTSLFSNVPGAPPEAFVANRLYAQIAGWMATSATAIDLSDAVVQQLLALSVVTTLGIEVDPEIIRTAAEIVAAGSAKIDDAGGSGNLVEEIAQVQVVAQGNVREQFAAVATGVTDIQTVHAEYTGPNLDASVTAAETGNVVPVLLRIDDVRITELNDGTAVADFTVSSSGPSKLPITVEYTTFDLDASAAEGDYTPSAGTLSWDAGDASPRAVRVLVHGDAICEGDETFGVFLFNSTNAAIRRREAVGTILNDDRFSYSAPNDAQANRLELYVSGDNLQLLRNEEVILAGAFSEPLSIEIEGAAEVANTLEILVEPGVVAPPHVVSFSGPGTNDQVRLLDADAPHSVHSRLSSTVGTYEIGGLEVHFTGIEQLSHELIPVVQGLDGQFLQGSPVSLSAVVAPGWQVAELHWEIISGGSLVASGQGESFTFTPARPGLFTARVSALQADYGTGILVADMRVSPTVDEDMVLVVSAPGVLEGYAAAAGQTLTAELITPPSHGDLALNPATGGFSYQAFENYYGTDAFTYRAYNGSSYSDPATVTITVTEVPDYQNPDLCEDVDHSGAVTSLDVLLGINRINAFGSELPPDPLRPATPTFYYDVNGNNSLGPLDVLITINYLNRGPTPVQGEGGDVGIQPFAATGATRALPNLEPAGTGADARQLIRSTPANSDLASRRRTVPERPGANRLPPARSRRHDTALAAFQQQTADPYSIALDDVLSLLAAEVAQAAV